MRIPGTNLRFGLDAVIGVIPGVGDVLGASLSTYIMVEAVRAGVPASVLSRMLANVTVDLLVGLVPWIGDVADIAWRANRRNANLLHRHLTSPETSRAAGRQLVVTVFVVLALLMAAVLLGVVALVRAAS